jgi:hypothetical protein
MVVLEAMSHGIPVIVSAAEFCGISAELNDVENCESRRQGIWLTIWIDPAACCRCHASGLTGPQRFCTLR